MTGFEGHLWFKMICTHMYDWKLLSVSSGGGVYILIQILVPINIYLHKMNMTANMNNEQKQNGWPWLLPVHQMYVQTPVTVSVLCERSRALYVYSSSVCVCAALHGCVNSYLFFHQFNFQFFISSKGYLIHVHVIFVIALKSDCCQTKAPKRN